MTYDERTREYTRIQQDSGQKIFVYCLFFVSGNHCLASDLYCHVMEQIWEGLESHDGNAEGLMPWVYRIVKNTAITLWRHKEAERRCLRQIPLEEPDEAETERINTLYRLIEKLDKLDRTIVYLYLDQVPQGEIARAVGLSETNVSSRISRIKKKLKKMNDDEKDY